MVRVMKVALRFWGLTPDSAEDDDGPGEEGLCTDGMIKRLGEWRLMMKGFGSRSNYCKQSSGDAANLVRGILLDQALDTALGTGSSEGFVSRSRAVLSCQAPKLSSVTY